MLRYPTLSLSLSLSTLSTTEKRQNVTSLIGYNSRTVKDDVYCRPPFDIYLSALFENAEINSLMLCCDVWEHFFKNVKFLGLFFGQNSEFELKINFVLLIDNRLSFPKHPSKSQLSLVIIDMALLPTPRDPPYHWTRPTSSYGAVLRTESSRTCEQKASLLVRDCPTS